MRTLRPTRSWRFMGSAYRADHVGSFLRPSELLNARRVQMPLEIIQEIEDRHILRVLQRQKEISFGVFTDGELRRTNFMYRPKEIPGRCDRP